MRIAERCVLCGSTRFFDHPARLAPFISYRVFPQRPVYTVGEVLVLAKALQPLRPFSRLLKRLPVWKRPFPSILSAKHCQDCGVLFSDLRFDGSELGRVYCDYRGRSYVEDRERFEPGYSAINSLLGDDAEIAARKANLESVLVRAGIDTIKVTSVLDYGGDEGQFIPDSFAAARKIVYEVSDKRPLAGIEKIVELKGLPQIDFAMICHVLEHVSEPAEVLAEARNTLRPGGYLYLEVPMEMEDLDRPEHLTPGIVTFHEHINFFCSRSIGRLLEICGLVPIFNETITLFIHGKATKIVSAVGRVAP